MYNHIDLDECASGNPCPGEGMICQNTFMNYTCSCAQGYVMSDDGNTCISIGMSVIFLKGLCLGNLLNMWENQT